MYIVRVNFILQQAALSPKTSAFESPASPPASQFVLLLKAICRATVLALRPTVHPSRSSLVAFPDCRLFRQHAVFLLPHFTSSLHSRTSTSSLRASASQASFPPHYSTALLPKTKMARLSRNRRRPYCPGFSPTILQFQSTSYRRRWSRFVELEAPEDVLVTSIESPIIAPVLGPPALHTPAPKKLSLHPMACTNLYNSHFVVMSSLWPMIKDYSDIVGQSLNQNLSLTPRPLALYRITGELMMM